MSTSESMPESWQAWMARPVTAVASWPVDALLAPLLARSPESLGPWRWPEQAVRSSREERRRRILATVASGGVHLALWLAWLVWAWLHVPEPPASMPAQAGEAPMVVEYIGIGTPEVPGGGQPEPSDVSPADPPTPQADAAAVALPAALPDASASDVQPTPPASQPLVVTEVEQPDIPFVLPPTRVVTVPTPSPALRSAEVPVPQREVTLDTAPEAPTIVTRPIATPRAVAATPVVPITQSVRARDITLDTPPDPVTVRMPTPQPRPRDVAPAAVEAAAAVRARDVPLSERTPSSATAPTAAVDGRPSVSDRQQATAVPSPGAGPRPQATPGGWPDPKRGDDWGASTRQQPGGGTGQSADGLHGADGRPNLPSGTAAAGGGMPPGTDDWTRAGIDANGTWLKRPPLDYRASPFEDYWRPHETLLEEWVRRGVKQMHIPIPGTSKRITCVVSLLQLGGGCGITDPNVNDQEAVARPPPDIPYKPELQDDPSVLSQPPQPRD